MHRSKKLPGCTKEEGKHRGSGWGGCRSFSHRRRRHHRFFTTLVPATPTAATAGAAAGAGATAAASSSTGLELGGVGRKEEGGRGSGEIDRTAPNLERSVKPTREKGRRGTRGGAEERKGGGGGRGQLLRRRVPSPGVRALGLEGGKGRVAREGSGGGALCAAAVNVSVRLERVVASPFLWSVSRAMARACLPGFCLTG